MPPCSSAVLIKGNIFHDFLYASLKNKALKRELTLTGKNLLPGGANSFL